MAPTSGRDYFTALPFELQREIVSYLPLFHKLKLRTILSKQHGATVIDLIGDALRTIYVLPTQASLRRFYHICHFPFFQMSITKLAFLPFAAPAGMLNRLTFDEYRKKHEALSQIEAHISFALYTGYIAEHETDSPAAAAGGGRSPMVFATIRAGCDLLTRLEEIFVQYTIQENGLNACTLHYGSHYLIKRGLQGVRTLESERLRNAATDSARELLSVEQLESFFLAVQESQVKPKHIAIGRYRDVQTHFNIVPMGAFDPEILRKAVSHVEKLTISCSYSANLDHGHTSEMWQQIAESPMDLQSLTLIPCVPLAMVCGKPTNGWRKPFYGAEPTDHFLQYGYYRDLRKFTMKGRLHTPCFVETEKFQKFLFKHRRTLREVHLENIRLSTPPPPRVAGATAREEATITLDAMRELIRNIRNWLPELEVFRMLIVYLPGYALPSVQWMKVAEMEAFAEEMGIALKNGVSAYTGERVWDFGEAAMKFPE